METIKYNEDGVLDTEVDEVVTRVKAFIMSSKKNVLIGRTDDGYHLVEAQVFENDDMYQTMANAIAYQTCINLDNKDSIEPFFETRYYTKNYMGTSNNRLADTVYFLVKTDKLPSFKGMSQTEIDSKLPLEIMRRSEVLKYLNEFMNATPNVLQRAKTNEILLAYDHLRKAYNF